MKLPKALLRRKLLMFLEEDVGMGDITSEFVIPDGAKVKAQIIAKESCIVAGLYEMKLLFETLGIEVVKSVKDGDEVEAGTVIAEIIGDSHAVLMAERTVLNLLTRMSGIATATKRLLDKVKNHGRNIRIAATRKTAPGLRYFDKRAVAIGGGDTHRFRLDDAILIKDNHIFIAGGVENALKRVHSRVSFTKKVEIEVKKPEEALLAAKLGADIIMLDGMTPEKVKETMELLNRSNLRDRVLIEVSGNITEENITEYAKLEPDVISLGALTHSAKAVDMSLEIVKVL